MRDTRRIIVVCKAQICPFGLTKIDDQCHVCRYNEELVVTGPIKPVIVENTREIVFSCYKNEKLPLHDACVFDRNMPSEGCRGCVRLIERIVKSETKEI